MTAEALKARQQRWDARRREIIRERRQVAREAEDAGLAFVPPAPLSTEPPDWFEPAQRDGEVTEITLPSPLTQEACGTVPAEYAGSLFPYGDVVVPAEAAGRMLTQPMEPPRKPPSALDKIDAVRARLERSLRRS